MQHKTQRPVQFAITPATREVLQKWIKQAGLKSEDFVFPSRIHNLSEAESGPASCSPARIRGDRPVSKLLPPLARGGTLPMAASSCHWLGAASW